MKVIAIPDKYTILISYPSDITIKKGALVEIYAKGKEVKIPGEDKSYGTYDYIKDIVEVTQVYSSFVECQKLESVGINNSFLVSPLFKMNKKVATELRVNIEDIDDSLSINLSEDNKTIKINDLARLSFNN